MAVYFVPKEKRECLKPLVEGWDETMIWSCIQGCMGEVYADSINMPLSARFVIGDFCFFAGKPVRELVENRKGFQNPFVIMVPQNSEWEALIEDAYQDKAKKVTRYAIKKEQGVFDEEKLQAFSEKLNPDYQLSLMDHKLYEEAMAGDWSRDLVSNFESGDDYLERGMGVSVLHDGHMVAGASSYTVYHGGIEIEIDTKKEYRRRGLALAAGAKLILECLERGKYPSWDAQNRESVALAEKLGYHFEREYTAYEVAL